MGYLVREAFLLSCGFGNALNLYGFCRLGGLGTFLAIQGNTLLQAGRTMTEQALVVFRRARRDWGSWALRTLDAYVHRCDQIARLINR